MGQNLQRPFRNADLKTAKKHVEGLRLRCTPGPTSLLKLGSWSGGGVQVFGGTELQTWTVTCSRPMVSSTAAPLPFQSRAAPLPGEQCCFCPCLSPGSLPVTAQPSLRAEVSASPEQPARGPPRGGESAGSSSRGCRVRGHRALGKAGRGRGRGTLLSLLLSVFWRKHLELIPVICSFKA